MGGRACGATRRAQCRTSSSERFLGAPGRLHDSAPLTQSVDSPPATPRQCPRRRQQSDRDSQMVRPPTPRRGTSCRHHAWRLRCRHRRCQIQSWARPSKSVDRHEGSILHGVSHRLLNAFLIGDCHGLRGAKRYTRWLCAWPERESRGSNPAPPVRAHQSRRRQV